MDNSKDINIKIVAKPNGQIVVESDANEGGKVTAILLSQAIRDFRKVMWLHSDLNIFQEDVLFAQIVTSMKREIDKFEEEMSKNSEPGLDSDEIIALLRAIAGDNDD